jgi:hypothetical protein
MPTLPRAGHSGTLPWPWIDPDKALPWVADRLRLTFAESQIAAIRALASKALVITGGPGVGKTTIVKGILRILSAKGADVDNSVGRPTLIKIVYNRIRVGCHSACVPGRRICRQRRLLRQVFPAAVLDRVRPGTDDRREAEAGSAHGRWRIALAPPCPTAANMKGVADLTARCRSRVGVRVGQKRSAIFGCVICLTN